MTRTPRHRAIAALVAASFLFGATFVVVKDAVTDIEPISFVAWRFLIGAVVLLALGWPRGGDIWRHGTMAGIALFLGYALQTAGLQYTAASNSALITGMYVVFTPFLASILARKAPNPWVVTGAGLAFAGVYLLTGVDSLSLGPGDILTLGCALAFAFHIVILGRFAHRHPVIPFTAAQLVVTTVLAFGFSWVFEGNPTLPPRSVWGSLLLTGVGITAGAFLLQIWAQTVVGAGTAAVVLAAEPAFGVATGVLLGERLTARGWAGAGLIVVAIYIVVTKQRDETSREAEAVTAAH